MRPGRDSFGETISDAAPERIRYSRSPARFLRIYRNSPVSPGPKTIESPGVNRTRLTYGLPSTVSVAAKLRQSSRMPSVFGQSRARTPDAPPS